MSSRTRSVVMTSLLLLIGTSTFAQDEPVSQDEKTVSPLERLIYVPYRRLRDVFEKNNGSAVIPYAEYLRLLGQPLRPKIAAPPEAVITKARYEAAVEGDIARVNLTLTVVIPGKQPWARVPVSFGDAAIGSVDSDNAKVLLLGTGNGTYALVFSETGEQTVRMELVARVRTSPQGRRLQMKIPRVGITELQLTIPRADQTVALQPDRVVRGLDAGDNVTRIESNVGSTDQIVASWTPRAGSRPQMELLSSVTNNIDVRIDEGLIHRTANMKFAVLRGEMSELSFVVPPGDRLLDVVAAGGQVRKWTAEKQDNRQVVKVQLLEPTDKDIELQVHTEQTMTDGAFRIGGITADGTVHGIHALDVVRESGQLSIKSSAQLALSVANQERVTRTSQSAGGFAWRFYGTDMNVGVRVETVRPRVIVSQVAQFRIGSDSELKLRADFTATIERAGVFEILISVPEGLTVDSVQGNGVRDFGVRDGTLRVMFADKKLGQTAFRVMAQQDFAAANDAAAPLPFLASRGTERESGNVSVFAPAGTEVITEEQSVTGLYPMDSARGTAPGLVSQWAWSKGPVSMSVRTRRKPARLTANVDTRISVEPRVVTVKTVIHHSVENAGLDTFRIAVPEAVADSLRLTSGQAIKQKTRDADASDGWVTWTVVLQKKVQGQFVLNAAYDLTRDDAAADIQLRNTIEPVRVLSAGPESGVAPVQVSGDIAIDKHQSLSVNAAVEGKDIKPIDVREFLRMKKDGSLAYRYFEQDARVNVTAVRYAIHPVVETVVSRAAVEILLGHDSTATYLCRYRLTSSERQRLRIDLPPEAEMLDQRVDQTRISLTPVDGRDGWQSFYANYATAVAGGDATREFTLTLHFRARIAGGGEDPFDGIRGSLKLRIPRLGDENSALVVQQTKCAIWLPNDYALVGHPRRYVREFVSRFGDAWPLRLVRASSERELTDWVGGDGGGMVDFPREGHSYLFSSQGDTDQITLHWWDMPVWVWIISGSVLLVGFVLRRTPWENKLTVVLVVAFVAVLYALRDQNQESVLQLVCAGMYGVVAVTLLWVFSSLGRQRTESPSPAAPVLATAGPPGATTPTVPPVTPPPEAEDAAAKDGGSHG